MGLVYVYADHADYTEISAVANSNNEVIFHNISAFRLCFSARTHAYTCEMCGKNFALRMPAIHNISIARPYIYIQLKSLFTKDILQAA